MSELNEAIPVNDDERVVPASEIFASHIRFAVILADNTTYDGQAYTSASGFDLSVAISASSGATMAELFNVFTDPGKTCLIKSQIIDTEEPKIFEGYTTFNGIRQNIDGSFAITMLKQV